MPYYFKFYIHDNLHFIASLHCHRCIGIARNGSRCRRKVCIGLPFCFQHLESTLHLKIKPSTIPNSGKGLYAINKRMRPNAVIFYADAEICRYYGEIVNSNTLNRRYTREYTAPYGVTINSSSDRYEDGALDRGVGSIANHKPHNDGANAQLRVRDNVIILQASKPIRNGEEIFVDYGREYDFDEDTYFKTVYL